MSRPLFNPFRIGSIEIPNRLVRSATWEGMCTPEGVAEPRLSDLYCDLARGGVGLIISGYAYVREDGKQLPGKMGMYRNSLLPALTALTDAVHEAEGTIFCQLVHAGGQATNKATNFQALAPSALENRLYPAVPREMTVDDINLLIDAFAEAALRARDGGFDGVQLHGAHGYLISQFLSPLTNQRQDDYGGSLENRMRFLVRVYQAVRTATGPGYPVTIKLNASDNIPGGFTIDEAVIVAKELDALGIDAIEVSSGNAASGLLGPVRQGIDTTEKEAYNAAFAKTIKEQVQAPVMVVGGLRSLPVIENMLERGAADLFSLSRPLIREPGLVNHWHRGKNYRATCISCNGCFRPGLKGEGIRCVLDS